MNTTTEIAKALKLRKKVKKNKNGFDSALMNLGVSLSK